MVNSLEHFNEPVPPLHICANLAEEAAPQWNDLTIRTSLNLFLSILPLDHPLIHNLAKTYATASNDIKRVSRRTCFRNSFMLLFLSRSRSLQLFS